MAEQARVSSTEAIESFRTALLVYVSKTKAMLEDAADETTRTREWIQNDRRVHWEMQVRRRKQLLEQAQQALFSAEFSALREATTAERTAVQKAKRALREAEEKLDTVKRWSRDYDNRVQPLLKQLEQVRTLLANDLPRAALHLNEIVKTLEEYAGISRLGARIEEPLPADTAEERQAT